MTPDDYAKHRALELSEALTTAQAEIAKGQHDIGVVIDGCAAINAEKDREIASLRSLLAVAEGALEPFAKFVEAAELMTRGTSHNTVLTLSLKDAFYLLVVGHFRVARTTLAAIREKTDAT